MASSPVRRGWSYARAGVDRAPVGAALRRLLEAVRYRPPPTSGRRVELEGHYAGLLRIGRETIAITTDTVGTKTVLARQLGRWEEVGEDVVAVNVNDLAAVGARPAGFVDCISLDRPDPSTFAALGRGMRRGLRAARCHLMGGETAVVPELIDGVDLGGTAFGFFPGRRRPVTGARIRPGDRLVGLPSSGLHANGLTLARRIVRERRWPLGRPRPGGRAGLGRELLTPTRIYVRPAEAVADRAEVTGFAHISGGGVRNLIRLNPEVEFVLDDWPPVPPLATFLQRAGPIAPEEMYQTFNMGIGFIVVVRPTHLGPLLRRLARAGAADARVVGRVVRGRGVTLPGPRLHYDHYG